MERKLLAPLAGNSTATPVNVPLAATIDAQLTIAVKPVQGARVITHTPNTSAGRLAEEARNNRRWHQLLEQSTAARELNNEITQHQIAEKTILKKQAKGQPLTGHLQQILTELGRVRELQNLTRELRIESEAIEDAAVEAFHGDDIVENPALRARLDVAIAGWDALILRLYARSAERCGEPGLLQRGSRHAARLHRRVSQTGRIAQPESRSGALPAAGGSGPLQQTADAGCAEVGGAQRLARRLPP